MTEPGRQLALSLGYTWSLPEFAWVIHTQENPPVILDLGDLNPQDRITSFSADRYSNFMISQFEVKELAVHKEKKENFAQFLKNISTILVGGDGCHLHCYEALKIMKENNMFRHYKAFTMMNFSEDGSEEAVKALKLDDVGYFWLTNWRGHDLKEHAQQLLFNGKLRSLTLLGGNNFISMESFQQYLDRHMDDTTYNIDLLCRVEDVNAFWIRDYRKEKQVDVDKLKPINIQGATTFLKANGQHLHVLGYEVDHGVHVNILDAEPKEENIELEALKL